MRKAGVILLLSGLLALPGCSEKEIVPESKPLPRLRSITVSTESLVLDEGDKGTLSFSVKDQDYVFTALKLAKTSGETPQEFVLDGFSPGSEVGAYTAVIRDAGTRTAYEEQVCLSIALRNPDTGVESFVVSNAFKVASARKGPQTGLPVVFVDTENGAPIESKEDYVPATLSISGKGEYDNLAASACSVRGRGNTTWSWPKKPYLVKLEEKAKVLGMHKHKRWVLLANFLDRTLMRNLVSMKVASLTSLAWTPSCVPVELVLNDKHMGSYLLIEQVRVDNHRVDITEMTPQDNTGEALTGGYLLECDFHYDNEIQWLDPHGHSSVSWNGIPFGIKYPDPDEITPAQINYIKSYVAQTATALYGPDFKDPEKGYAHYLDVDSFVDYWIVFEVMGNHELGNPGSVFMHKDRGGKLVAGPCWDFDWGVLSYNTSPQARTGLINGKAIWYERLFQDPAFREKVKARFQELLPQLQTIPSYMDQCEALLTESARLNFQMWNPAEDASMNGGSIINGDEYLSFHQAVARIRSIYQDRLAIIPEKL